MKTITCVLLFGFALVSGCGGEDDSCTPGSGGGAEATCSQDSDCQSCDCYFPPDSETGFCRPQAS